MAPVAGALILGLGWVNAMQIMGLLVQFGAWSLAHEIPVVAGLCLTGPAVLVFAAFMGLTFLFCPPCRPRPGWW
jgi:hypothetical protein